MNCEIEFRVPHRVRAPWFVSETKLSDADPFQRPHGMIGTVEIEFCGDPSIILSLIAT
jgi:hypothetical protein